jgi:hypothetical protein
MNEAGALGFRDFPGLLVTKENRNGSHQTLHSIFFTAISGCKSPRPTSLTTGEINAAYSLIEGLARPAHLQVKQYQHQNYGGTVDHIQDCFDGHWAIVGH